ncbi:hypothetical protein [Streptomyces sp. NPDC048611]|uniref:hypothetical protein n=1 Tax=Streptomyces sp. NPDC048611 TaxID=3155635 RepID=UPI00341C62D4
MPIVSRGGASSNGNGNSNGLSPFVFTSSAQHNDLYIACITMASDNAINAFTWPSGWSMLEAQETAGAGGGFCRAEIGWTIWHQGDGSGKSGTLNTALINGGWTCSSWGWDGVETSNPILQHAMGTMNTASSSSAVATPTATDSTTGVWRAEFFQGFALSAARSWSGYSPADTERLDANYPLNTNRPAAAIVDSGAIIDASSGTSVSGTPSGAIYCGVGSIALLNPAPPVPPRPRNFNQAVTRGSIF